jgi:hypothetical protein
MPTIADSSIELFTPTIPVPVNAPVVVAPIARPVSLRSQLPPDEVLDTVTSQANSTSGATPMWKPVAVVSKPTTPSSSSPSSQPSTTPTAGVPAEVSNISAVQTPYSAADGTTKSLVTVNFTRYSGDTYFAGVQIWFTNYQGNANPVLVAQGPASPVTFVVPATGENVTVTVVAFGPTGLTASFLNAPTTTVLLSGATNPPPAPTLYQGLTALAGGAGWQFGFYPETGALQNIISGYWVYKNNTGTTPVGIVARYHFIPQPAAGSGPIIYSDADPTTEYYWVSAITTSGLESALTSATPPVLTGAEAPTVATPSSGNYLNPMNVADGDLTTASIGTESATTGSHSMTQQWSGFAAASGSPKAITLNITSQVQMTIDGGTGTCSLAYSLDNGTTWTNLYNLENANYAYQTNQISLSLTQDLTKVLVQGSINATAFTIIKNGLTVVESASVNHYVYDINIAISE